MDIADGFHIQANSLPEGYIPIHISVEGPKGVTAPPFTYPTPEPLSTASLADELNVYTGSIQPQTPVTFKVRENVTQTLNIDSHACSDSDCLLPESHTIELNTKWFPNP
ncbi:MAG: hypothetical protein CME19_15930 [Gemmatimonadetes bacterium]|nr:hypothetical protein [Gemmatimonadota bacterium]|tara:strand:+ start:846 stop:1172 length:327 start_codon:yes stop_codon:yes gene_type:complete